MCKMVSPTSVHVMVTLAAIVSQRGWPVPICQACHNPYLLVNVIFVYFILLFFFIVIITLFHSIVSYPLNSNILDVLKSISVRITVKIDICIHTVCISYIWWYGSVWGPPALSRVCVESLRQEELISLMLFTSHHEGYKKWGQLRFSLGTSFPRRLC